MLFPVVPSCPPALLLGPSHPAGLGHLLFLHCPVGPCLCAVSDMLETWLSPRRVSAHSPCQLPQLQEEVRGVFRGSILLVHLWLVTMDSARWLYGPCGCWRAGYSQIPTRELPGAGQRPGQCCPVPFKDTPGPTCRPVLRAGVTRMVLGKCDTTHPAPARSVRPGLTQWVLPEFQVTPWHRYPVSLCQAGPLQPPCQCWPGRTPQPQ